MEKARIAWQVTHSDGRVEVWTRLRDALESVGLAPAELADSWTGDPRPEAGAEVAMIMMRSDRDAVTVYTTLQLYRTLCAMRDGKAMLWDKRTGYVRDGAIRVAAKRENWFNGRGLSC